MELLHIQYTKLNSGQLWNELKQSTYSWDYTKMMCINIPDCGFELQGKIPGDCFRWPPCIFNTHNRKANNYELNRSAELGSNAICDMSNNLPLSLWTKKKWTWLGLHWFGPVFRSAEIQQISSHNCACKICKILVNFEMLDK